MDSHNSSKFLVGSLVTFFLLFLVAQIILVSALNLSKNAVKPESMLETDIASRIEPVAHAYVGEPPVIETVVDDLSPGEQVVKQVCARCHRAGLMGAPKLGKAKDWLPRLDKKGIETFYKNALYGMNKMPARGGRASLSDEKVIAAVDHMISIAK